MTTAPPHEMTMETWDRQLRPAAQKIRSGLTTDRDVAATAMRWVKTLFHEGVYDLIHDEEALPPLFDQVSALEKAVTVAENHPASPILDVDERAALKAVLTEKTKTLEHLTDALNVWCTARIISEMEESELDNPENDYRGMIAAESFHPMSAADLVIHHVTHHHGRGNAHQLPVIVIGPQAAGKKKRA